MIVLAIMALGAVYAADRTRNSVEDTLAQTAADNITTVGKAVAAYIGANSGSLAAVQDITIATLQTAGSLPTTFNGTTPWQSGYSIRIRRSNATAPFLYEGLVLTTNPWLNGTAVRTDLVGSAVRKIGGAGGMTYDTTSGVAGQRGAWTVPLANYPAANRAGQLAYFVAGSTNPNDLIYLRRDGAYAMTGALNMGSNDIGSAGNVTSTGTVTGNSLTATSGTITLPSGGTISAGGRLHVQSAETLYLQPWANAYGSRTYFGGGGGSGAITATAGTITTVGATTVNATTVNATTVNSTDVSATGNVAAATVTGNTVNSNGDFNMTSSGTLRSGGRMHIQANENLYLQPWSNASGSPTIVGGGGGSGNLTVYNDITLHGLSSRANAPNTTSVVSLLPKLVEVGNQVVNAHGTFVAAPSCPSPGVASGFILPHVGSGYVSNGLFGTSVRLNAASGGWTVDARDANGATIPSAAIPAGNFAAIVRTFCTY